MPDIRNENWSTTFYLNYSYVLPTDTWNGFSSQGGIGLRMLHGKGYKLGFGVGIDFNRFIAKDTIAGTDALENNRETKIRSTQVRLELMQRIEIIRNGLMWDLGVYGGINCTRTIRTTDKMKWYDDNQNQIYPYKEKVESIYRRCKNINLFEYGINTRLYYTLLGQINLGVTGSYRLSDVITKKDQILGTPDNNPSPWSVGLELELLF